jgi:thiamine pyrophosphokinase
MTARKWAPSFLAENDVSTSTKESALIILNQPFSLGLLWKLWKASSWRACADGGANRLYDSFSGELRDLRNRYFLFTFSCIEKLNEYSIADFSPT